MIRGKTMRAVASASAAVLVLSIAAPAAAETGAVARSLLVPGLGQAHQGHYTRAAVFGSAAVMAWAGLFATQINYSRSREKYENEKRTYLYYDVQRQSGQVVRASDIDATYAAMQAAYSEADDNQQWRNVFIGALAVTYAASLVDILLSKPDSGELEPALSVEWTGDGVRVSRAVKF